ncbi:helix-turn-helix transcriptional regulator [Metallosphaera sedula]|uniref:helix-turn-helix transcriptional regulator n=1 Tax=Metallosphaera sedula TaxID=43687 RepID=UPI0020BFB550|nr:winged helix-turn-helix transcriptional regulator [Metallosphaera sedula]BBL46959.1 hypothetical protein MJ1HA_1060 [Metallosphaera sedula]
MNEQLPREEIIIFLKRNNRASLKAIADHLGMTKMGAYKHMVKLEDEGLVSRKVIKKPIGRPEYIFELTDKGKQFFQNSDSLILNELLNFLEREGYSNIVIKFLQERIRHLTREYTEKMKNKELEERVEVLRELRCRDGYMAEVKRVGNSFELIELNCPIYKVASIYGEACQLERNLFAKVLDAEVQSTHRQVIGSPICRFLVSKKGEAIIE